MRELTTPRRLRLAAGVLAGTCAAVAAIGAMHTAPGRVLLARLGVPCPVDTVNPALVLAVRDDAVALARGRTPAPARPALGLQLDRSTREQVGAWLARSGTRCDAITRGYRYLRCRGVPAASLGLAGPPVSEVWFSFGPADTLIAINLYRRSMDPAQARQSWDVAITHLRQALGSPMRTTGDTRLATLFAQPVAVARVQYVYADYLATVTASHLPYGGLAVREQYMSTAATAPATPSTASTGATSLTGHPA